MSISSVTFTRLSTCLFAVGWLGAATLQGRAQGLLLARDGTTPGERLGTAVCGVGDWDGDGVLDIAVSGPGLAASGGVGHVSVLSGQDGSPLVGFVYLLPVSRFGYAIAGIGDTSGNGFRELVVGAPDHAGGGRRAGALFVVGGNNMQRQGTTGDQLGLAVSAFGDVDGDGFDEFLVGAPQTGLHGQEGNGYVEVLSGRKQQVLHRAVGTVKGAGFGAALARVGDQDGDGIEDFLVGAPFDDGLAQDGGAVELRSGVDGSFRMRISGAQAGARLGAALAGVGDLDGDGVGDYVTGAPGHDGVQGDTGEVRVWSGRGVSILGVLNGEHAGQRFGLAVASAGDFDGDGTADLLVASRGRPDRGYPGDVSVVSGAVLHVVAVYEGSEPHGYFGAALAPAGDVNGDGLDDILLGSPGVDARFEDVGRMLLIGGH